MADHSTLIATIDGLLRSGAKSVMVDGASIAIDRDELRRQRRDLINEDDASQEKRRPMAVSQYLGGY